MHAVAAGLTEEIDQMPFVSSGALVKPDYVPCEDHPRDAAEHQRQPEEKEDVPQGDRLADPAVGAALNEPFRRHGHARAASPMSAAVDLNETILGVAQNQHGQRPCVHALHV